MGKIRITHYGGNKTICDEKDYDKHIGSISYWEKIDDELVEECKEVIKAYERRN